VDPIKGQLVVLKTRWNIQSNRIGVILDRVEDTKDAVIVMWTDVANGGIKIKTHLIDALFQVNDATSERIKERICDIK
jgi:hypothetical protein